MNSKSTNIARNIMAATTFGYLHNCAKMRADGADRAGSYYPSMTSGALLDALWSAEWSEVEHAAVAAPARVFRSDGLQGITGIVPLRDLPPEQTVTLEDPKGTGFLSAVIEETQLDRASVEKAQRQPTFLIVGPNNGPLVVYTFHPGEPIAPSKVAAATVSFRLVSVASAIALGLTHAKLRAEDSR